MSVSLGQKKFDVVVLLFRERTCVDFGDIYSNVVLIIGPVPQVAIVNNNNYHYTVIFLFFL